MALLLWTSKSSANMFFQFVRHLKVISFYIFILTLTVANSRGGVYILGEILLPPHTHVRDQKLLTEVGQL